MSAMKALYTELEELNVEVDFNNRDDIYDLVVDMRLGGVKLSPLMCRAVVGCLEDDAAIQSLVWNDEFVSALEWHIG